VVDECPPKGFGAAKTCKVRGVCNSAPGIECGTGGIDSNQFDILGGRRPKFGSKQAGQLACAERGPCGQGSHAVIRARVGCNRVGDHSER
jgi:hypothetical protein